MIHKMEADGIVLELGVKKLLSDIYVHCETGKVTALLGRNGCGKTCLMNVMYGNMNPNSKSVRFDGKVVPVPFARPDLLLYLPQFNFVPGEFRLKKVFSHFDLEYAHFETLFPEFKLKYKERVGSLSGGQRRLLEIYLVLMANSKFAMLDEPFSLLSPIFIEIVRELIVRQKEKKGILVTDHMFRHIITISDEIYLLADGQTRKIKDINQLETLGYAKM